MSPPSTSTATTSRSPGVRPEGPRHRDAHARGVAGQARADRHPELRRVHEAAGANGPAAGAGDPGDATPGTTASSRRAAGTGGSRTSSIASRSTTSGGRPVVQVVARQRQRRLEGEGDRRRRPSPSWSRTRAATRCWASRGAKWVELTDEERVLRGVPGVLLQVRTGHRDAVRSCNPGNLSLAVGHESDTAAMGRRGTVAANSPIELEDGVQVEIDGGTFGGGDYWLIPARTLTGKVEWPGTRLPPAPDLRAPPRDGAPLLRARRGGLRRGRLRRPPGLSRAVPAADRHRGPTCPTTRRVRQPGRHADGAAGDRHLCRAARRRRAGHPYREGHAHERHAARERRARRPAGTGARASRSPATSRSSRTACATCTGMPNPVCRVTLDLPWPTTSTDRDLWRCRQLRLRRLHRPPRWRRTSMPTTTRSSGCRSSKRRTTCRPGWPRGC